ncbi:MAG: VIT1/CCC1 transporter family protein, partial [Candidatus Acidoferrales bacterium]
MDKQRLIPGYLGARSEQELQRSRGLAGERTSHALGHGAAIYLAFVLAGAVPLMPFLLVDAGNVFPASSLATGVTLFAVGSLR